MLKQYQMVELIKNLNPVIKAGMKGVILEIYDENTYEVEFVNDDGINLQYEGNTHLQ